MNEKYKQKSAEERTTRREEILNWIERVGPFSVPITELSKKHNCSRNTIYRDIENFIKKMDFKDVQKTGKMVLQTTKQNIKSAEELRIHSNEKVRLGAIGAINNSADTFTRLLAEYGYKEKAKEFMEHGGTVIFQEQVISEEEINERKNRDKANQTEREAETDPQNS